MKLNHSQFLAAAVLAALSTASLCAIEAGGVSIHGALSLTGAYSSKYNYLGDTADQVDANIRELTVNGAHRFENGVRASAQVYAYELAGYKDLALDFATVDYSFKESFGLRAGRNKLAQGLYGEVQDLDQVRTFASLPLHFYPRVQRAFTAGYNGVGAYGTVSLPKAGSLDYQLSGGYMDNESGDSPFSRGIASLYTATNVNLDRILSAAVAWNTPVEGLKLSYTVNHLTDIHLNGRLQTKAEMTAVDYPLTTANYIDSVYGAGAWDRSGLFAGRPMLGVFDVTVQVVSVEYTKDKFVGSFEYKRRKDSGEVNIPALGIARQPFDGKENHWYVQGTYQFTDKLAAGLYFASSDYDPDGTSGNPSSRTRVKDYAAAVSYALKDYWLVKFEVHQLDGLGALNESGDRNPGATKTKWDYLVVKTTFSF